MDPDGIDRNELKRQAAQAALQFVEGGVIGVGTGSTVNYFIDLLAQVKDRLEGAVSSSQASSSRLEALGIPVLDLNEVGWLDVYIDGADEANRRLELIKGGGGALTREKIVAAASRRFVCIADESKLVDELGHFPLPIEIIPMARSLVTARLEELGGRPQLRHGFVTDNGNQILDVHGLRIRDPIGLETELNNIPGVVCVGIFALRPADLLLLSTPVGVQMLRREGAA